MSHFNEHRIMQQVYNYQVCFRNKKLTVLQSLLLAKMGQ